MMTSTQCRLLQVQEHLDHIAKEAGERRNYELEQWMKTTSQRITKAQQMIEKELAKCED